MNLLPENISTFGSQLDDLTYLITYFAVVWFFASIGVILYFLVKYRRSANPKATYFNGASLKELKYLLVVMVLVVLCDFYIDIRTVSVWDHIKIQSPVADEVSGKNPHKLNIGILAYQWAWAFIYPGPDGQLHTADDVYSYGEFHVPINKNIVFDLGARDVLHSFWVKELRLKQDAVPGRIIKGWFNATKEGSYEIMCAEICGIMHTNMKGALIIESEEKYNAFIENLYAPKTGLNDKSNNNLLVNNQKENK